MTESGYRNSVAWDQAVRDPEVEKAIAPLVDRRLVRVEGAPPRARIELTHDVLTEPIVESRNRRRVREEGERAREEEARVRAAAASEEQRRRERAELDTKRQELRVGIRRPLRGRLPCWAASPSSPTRRIRRKRSR